MIYQVGQPFYRYQLTASINDLEQIYAHANMKTYYVISVTPKGAWIARCEWSQKHFILERAAKKYAYETKELAWESAKIRMRRRVMYLKRDLARAEAILEQFGKQERHPDIDYVSLRSTIFLNSNFTFNS